MAVQVSWSLKIEGRRFVTSAPEFGDETHDGPDRGEDQHPLADPLHLTFGVSAVDLPELTRLVGREALLLARDHRQVARMKLLKVDSSLNLAICLLLEATEALGPGWRQEGQDPFNR